MTREKFTFYGSWLDAVGHLSGELRGEVLTAIVEYGLYGETNSARGSVTKAILELVNHRLTGTGNKKGFNRKTDREWVTLKKSLSSLIVNGWKC